MHSKHTTAWAGELGSTSRMAHLLIKVGIEPRVLQGLYVTDEVLRDRPNTSPGNRIHWEQRHGVARLLEKLEDRHALTDPGAVRGDQQRHQLLRVEAPELGAPAVGRRHRPPLEGQALQVERDAHPEGAGRGALAIQRQVPLRTLRHGSRLGPARPGPARLRLAAHRQGLHARAAGAPGGQQWRPGTAFDNGRQSKWERNTNVITSDRVSVILLSTVFRLHLNQPWGWIGVMLLSLSFSLSTRNRRPARGNHNPSNALYINLTRKVLVTSAHVGVVIGQT